MDQGCALLASAKVPTPHDIRRGIEDAVDAVLRVSRVDPTRLRRVMVGTTQATNAIIERRALRKVAVIRLGGPFTAAVPPLSTWPEDLRAAVSAGEIIVAGGCGYDGEELSPLDRDAIARFAAGTAGTANAVAITGVFSSIVQRELGDVEICLSHEIGTIGLIERENATVLNAALISVAGSVAGALDVALAGRNVVADLFFTQNDGTLMALEFALRFPVLTIASGPANSMRGAAFLSGVDDAVVVDVGGSSADIGVLVRGFPHESSSPVAIGAVETNFRMPDILSVRLGGGTRINVAGRHARLGESVGNRLATEALVFGGSTATLTDAAVDAGRMDLGTHRVPLSRRESLASALAEAEAARRRGRRGGPRPRPRHRRQ